MRTEEICKLRVDELKKEDGIWFFDIKGKVKTRNSVRRVPIHEKLIGNITHHEASIQDQHLAALKSIVEKRKRQIKAEEEAKQAKERLELAASNSWPTAHAERTSFAWAQFFTYGDSTRV